MVSISTSNIHECRCADWFVSVVVKGLSLGSSPRCWSPHSHEHGSFLTSKADALL